MKKVIKRFSAIYGNETIKAVFHSVVQETKIPTGLEPKNFASDVFEFDQELERQVEIKPVPEKPLRNISYVSEAFTAETKDTTQVVDNGFEERFDSEHSTKSNDKVNILHRYLISNLL